MQNINLSAVILTKDSEVYIKNCLRSLSFADEKIVIDDYSTDKTVEIAKKYGAKIYKRNLSGDFATQRNYGLGKARGKWIFFVDSDEIIPPDLKSEIVQAINNPFVGTDGFYLKRLDNIWGKTLKHGETGNIKFLRLAKKDGGLWHRKVHEVWKVAGQSRTLNVPILHLPHQTLHEFIDDINMMSDIDVRAKIDEKKRSSLQKIIFWPVGKLVWNWKFRLGFLDGTQGMVMALMMSFHSFLSWSKLWMNQKHSH